MAKRPQNRFTRDDLRNHAKILDALNEERASMARVGYHMTDYIAHLYDVLRMVTDELKRTREAKP